MPTKTQRTRAMAKCKASINATPETVRTLRRGVEGLEEGEGADSQFGTPAAEDGGEEVPGGGKPFKQINGQVHNRRRRVC